MTRLASELPPVLAMAPNAWQGQWMNRQQILSRLAADGAKVVYTTGQWNSWDRINPAWRQASLLGGLETMDNVQIDRAPKWLFRFPAHRPLDYVGLALGSARYNRLMDRLDRSGFILLIYHPCFQPYATRLKYSHLVYYAYDLYERTPGWNEEDRLRENWLLKHAHLRIASSEQTAARLRLRSDMPVRTLPNGADVRAFLRARDLDFIPEDLARIGRPRIGYIGSLNRKVDLALVAELAAKNLRWNFVLVGPIGSLDDGTRSGLEACRRLDNVHELGFRTHNELPAYVANLDVALMPYRMGAGLWTSFGYPLKLHEYLAADVPIVSSHLPTLVEFDDVVAFAKSVEEWGKQIQRALNDGGVGAGRRTDVAAQFDWSILASVFSKWLIEISQYGSL